MSATPKIHGYIGCSTCGTKVYRQQDPITEIFWEALECQNCYEQFCDESCLDRHLKKKICVPHQKTQGLKHTDLIQTYLDAEKGVTSLKLAKRISLLVIDPKGQLLTHSIRAIPTQLDPPFKISEEVKTHLKAVFKSITERNIPSSDVIHCHFVIAQEDYYLGSLCLCLERISPSDSKDQPAELACSDE